MSTSRVIAKPQPRVQSTANSSAWAPHSGSQFHFQEMNIAAPTLSGRSSQEEVRRRQVLQYSEDKVKFQQKQKEKEDKKRKERHERYSHVTTGERLGVAEANISSVALQVPSSFTQHESQNDNPVSQRERKEEEYRKQMRERREMLQKHYNNQIAGSGI